MSGRELLDYVRRNRADEPLLAASVRHNLALVYDYLGRPEEAIEHAAAALAVREAEFAADDPRVAETVGLLGVSYLHAARYAEAEPLLLRALRERERRHGEAHAQTAAAQNNLAILYVRIGRYSEAEQLYDRSLKTKLARFGETHEEVATALNNLADLYSSQGRLEECVDSLRRSLAIREVLGNEAAIAASRANLGIAYLDLERYAEAETALRRSLAIREQELPSSHPDIAQCLNALAIVLSNSGRGGEAEPLYKRALLMRQEAYGQDHPEVAASLNNLAILYKEQGRHGEAEKLYRRLLAYYQRQGAAAGTAQAVALNNLASLNEVRGESQAAEEFYRRALALYEEIGGPRHPDVAHALNNLANLLHHAGRDAEADPLVERALAIREAGDAGAAALFQCYQVRARIRRALGRRDEAESDLEQALALAERQRAELAGGDSARAESFAAFAHAFERMVAWRAESGDAAGVLAAAERARARTLLEQLHLQGVDLLTGLPDEEAYELRRHDRAVRGELAGLRRQAEILRQDGRLSSEERSARLTALYGRIAQAQQDVLDSYADIRNRSPAYRLQHEAAPTHAALSELTAWVAQRGAILLYYTIGDESSHLLVVGPDGGTRLQTLSIDSAAAEGLGVALGPLTAARLAEALRVGDRQLLQLLANPDPSAAAHARLTALWSVVVPAAERELLLSGGAEQLLIVPDGPLASLPFAALVVGGGPEAPRFLLDEGPPILYAPSATVLLQLALRPVALRGDRKPVLTVGDPAYGPAVADEASAADVVELTPQGRFAARGGPLGRLPFSGQESTWVADVFHEQEIEVEELRGRDATEAYVRSNVSGRRVVHLACHGLVDQLHGNLFGALAFAPGPQAADAADDGFLTLAEIHELDLVGCELAILSACDTNYGPQQQGEGVWALSRGFLAAGSRRVVASNWLVDDEAGAGLVSYFASAVARDERRGEGVNYAAALQAAQRWVRGQEKWQSPYYWATFVLVGPD